MPLTILLVTVLFIGYFTVQLLFCFKAERLAVKLIPVFATAVPVALLALMFFGAFGQWSAGDIENVQEWVAGFLLIILGVGFIGDILAWAIRLTYIIIKNNGALASADNIPKGR